MWSNAGFDAFGIRRIDYREVEQRKNDQTLEFIWRFCCTKAFSGTNIRINCPQGFQLSWSRNTDFHPYLGMFFSGFHLRHLFLLILVQESAYRTPDEIAYDISLFINRDPRLPTYGVDISQQAENFVAMVCLKFSQSMSRNVAYIC